MSDVDQGDRATYDKMGFWRSYDSVILTGEEFLGLVPLRRPLSLAGSHQNQQLYVLRHPW
jgi:hypothetical protein